MGPNHVLVAYPLRELGDAHVLLGKPSDAVPMLERSLAIFEQELGRESTKVAKTLRSLGVALGSLGRTEPAVRELERARGIFEREYGPTHTQVETAARALERITRAPERIAQRWQTGVLII